MLKILAISDTHGFHENLEIPEAIDLVIHAGDASNWKDAYQNEAEMRRFLDWYGNLEVKYKVYIAGNHDTSIERKLVTKKDFQAHGITYLEHEHIEIEGINFFGSPYTPTFGNGWAYNKDRAKIGKLWDNIPVNTDVLITHGPPKYILDISENRDGKIEYCGDKSLLSTVEIIQPKYHIFGHIHDYQMHRNYGKRTVSDIYTTFVNATMVEDGCFDKGLIHQGIILNF